MEDFHNSYQFFMAKPSGAIKLFIFIIAGILLITFVWAVFARMDDIISASAALRPVNSISTVKTLVGGEVQAKYYSQNEYVNEGSLLLQLDSSADNLELKNSTDFLARINNSIAVQITLLETIRQNINTASVEDEEAFIHSEKYILENIQHLMQVEEIRIKLDNEKKLPELLSVRARLEEIERELEQAELLFSLWKNSRIIETTDYIKSLLLNKENLERHILDLERNIKNATIFSPISGRVVELRSFNVGDNIISGEDILNIIPDDDLGLKAELYIEPTYIARIKPGQKAVLRFPGLPPSIYGKIETEISLIPADYSFTQFASPFFIVETKNINPVFLSLTGDEVFLRAGISATCRIVIDNDTVFRMVLKKLDFINAGFSILRNSPTKILC